MPPWVGTCGGFYYSSTMKKFITSVMLMASLSMMSQDVMFSFSEACLYDKANNRSCFDNSGRVLLYGKEVIVEFEEGSIFMFEIAEVIARNTDQETGYTYTDYRIVSSEVGPHTPFVLQVFDAGLVQVGYRDGSFTQYRP